MFYYLWLSCCFFIPKAFSFDTSTPADITSTLNQYRSIILPSAKKMPCLTWSDTLASNTMSFAFGCTLPPSTDTSYVFDIRQNVDDSSGTYKSIFGDWLSQNINYDSDANTCVNGQNCNEFLTLWNDQANQFACSQGFCSSVGDRAASGGPYIYTVCQVDQPRPAGVPYEISDTGCSASTCVAPKSTCYNSSICCTPLPACVDTRSTCTPADCDNNPAEALVNCANTCNNCDGCKCYDSSKDASLCKSFRTLAFLCNLKSVYSVCLVSCNKCTTVRRSTCLN